MGDCSALPREDVQGSRLKGSRLKVKNRRSVGRGVDMFSVLGSWGFCWARRGSGVDFVFEFEFRFEG